MKQNPVVIGSSLGAIATSLVATATTLCCVGPAVMAILGTSGVVAAAKLAPYRPYFILDRLPCWAGGFGWPIVSKADVSARRAPRQAQRSHARFCGLLL
jgi:hypothetical protein